MLAIPLSAQDKTAAIPSMEFVMARLWKNFSMADATMTGILRTPSKTYPMEMRTKDREILMLVPEANLSVQIAFSSSTTSVKRGDGQGRNLKALTAREQKAPILDTDISYEDLALSFLNWPDIREVGVDSVKTLPAYVYDVDAPAGQSAYASVRFWVSSQYFALIRVDAKDKNGQTIKRVEVNGVQRVGDAWVVKEMQVSTFHPGRTSSKSRTYLEIRQVKVQ
ncbi:outer membrane lipoprotein-sorting protein [Geitlerinema calcuttense]|uniref:Outer membrane lipoprotein-sorting protein n=1 Tax=Geitlerinema calcuttense NRMC-F 0142 TaxID=2922238 RepID=A0ABT7LY61_9CYAN|nr:outer membrane lipoprotein-sorting protein [Geitlerinema calcuttense]MDL5056943.1 outer membrane lipoprotein-sorting protein [Geitlerinema calcuttense NRMC-F 0142]